MDGDTGLNATSSRRVSMQFGSYWKGKKQIKLLDTGLNRNEKQMLMIWNKGHSFEKFNLVSLSTNAARPNEYFLLFCFYCGYCHAVVFADGRGLWIDSVDYTYSYQNMWW